ncbi:TIGR02530 family flagellar biosynthesis protein [Paenibacillus beijingensis]|uniref:Flagellar biosynthesis protein n=1 Tax=Paenibacillus beijingensis TaxID=1126833 RepID=A0A0D5NNI0_9BACL|nr:TIGR02530 family flagellar biosynthesis protein [Paenibacillus beijingensis]AJY76572.1 hypothetical protein VN24_20875 [Paenibacillus beijingensis]
MDDRFKVGHMFPIVPKPAGTVKPALKTPSDFSRHLDDCILKFSHHAQQRIQQRGIRLQPETILNIGRAVDQAAAKGAVDSLIVGKDFAMIVNVPSRTVITALDKAQLKDNVFTQIDSAVFVP